MFGNQYYPSFQDRMGYNQQPQMPMMPVQQYDIIHVNGENGARAFRMAPNSRCLLLDDNEPIVWLAQTDGAGYPSLTPYSITPYHKQEPVASNFGDRLSRLEEYVYGKSYNVGADQAGPAVVQPSADDSAVPAVPAGNGRKKPAGTDK